MAKRFFLGNAAIANDTAFRAIGKAVSDAIQECGMVKTADTGQVDWATVTKPASSAFTYTGYEIYRFPDSAQQTANPVFIKLQYGTGSGATYFGMAIQVGHGSDGAGNLTGTVAPSTGYTLATGAQSSSLGNFNFICANDHTFTMLLFCGNSGTMTGSSGYHIAVSVDRLRDASGNATADGINLVWHTGYSSNYAGAVVLPAVGAMFPTTALVFPMCLIPTSAAGGISVPSGLGIEACFSYVYPYLGAPGNPDLGCIVYPAEVYQVPGGAAVEIEIYGVTHTFVCAGIWTSTVNGNSGANCSIGVLWE